MGRRYAQLFAAGLCVGLLALFAPYTDAYADLVPGESMTLSPVSKRYTLDAGTSQNGSITIINDGSSAYDFKVYAEPYYVSSGDYEPLYTSNRANADANTWFQLAKTQFHLEPGAKVDVPYVLVIPGGAAPGGHYGVLFAETLPDTAKATESVVRTKRLGTVFYLTINGQYRTDGTMGDIYANTFQFNSPLRAEAEVVNSGNVDFAVATEFTVRDIFGSVVHTVSKEYTVLPDTTRNLSYTWDGVSLAGLYQVHVSQKALGTEKQFTGYVLVVPVWVYAIVAVVVLGTVYYLVMKWRVGRMSFGRLRHEK